MMAAMRVLTLNAEQAEIEVPIRIFMPERGHDGGWRCRYEIEWPDRTWSSAGWGVDSVQAILIAMQKIGTELYVSEHHQSGKLTWGATGQGYGFPVPRNLRDLLVGDDAVFDG